MKERDGIRIYSFTDLLQKLTDENQCRLYLEQLVGCRCPYCNIELPNRNRIKKGNQYQCNKCKKWFSSLIGTEFEHTHVPLRKWLIVIFLVLYRGSMKISSHQIARDLAITQKTAWKMIQKIQSLNENGYKEIMIKKWKTRLNIDPDKYLPGTVEN